MARIEVDSIDGWEGSPVLLRDGQKFHIPEGCGDCGSSSYDEEITTRSSRTKNGINRGLGSGLLVGNIEESVLLDCFLGGSINLDLGGCLFVEIEGAVLLDCFVGGGGCIDLVRHGLLVDAKCRASGCKDEECCDDFHGGVVFVLGEMSERMNIMCLANIKCNTEPRTHVGTRSRTVAMMLSGADDDAPRCFV